MDSQHLALDIRIVLTGIFVVAGVFKIRRAGARELRSLLQAIGVPDVPVVRVCEKTLPFVEIGTGLWLLTAWRARDAMAVAGLLLLGFTFVIVLAMKRDYAGSCSCFGSRSRPPGWAGVSFLTLLFGGVVLGLTIEMRNEMPGLSVVDLHPVDLLVATGVASFLFGVRSMVGEIEGVSRLLEPGELPDDSLSQ